MIAVQCPSICAVWCAHVCGVMWCSCVGGACSIVNVHVFMVMCLCRTACVCSVCMDGCLVCVYLDE